MNASTSRIGLRGLARAKRIVPRRVQSFTPAVSVVRHSSSEPKRIGKGGKGKQNERYNYNTSMSFSDDLDPDVRDLWTKFEQVG
jgi:hypothetical protein